MYVPTFVSDALADWAEFSKEQATLREAQGASDSEVPTSWGTDEDRANLLAGLRTAWCLIIEDWHVDYVALYMKEAFPYSVLKEKSAAGLPSLFIRELYEAWAPKSLEDWIRLLWIYSQDGGYHAFADLVAFNHFSTGTPEFWRAKDLSNLGHILFVKGKDMFSFDEDVLELLIGGLIKNSKDPSAVKSHAVEVMRLLHSSEMADIGAGCRYLLRYRTRWRGCQCPRHCTCRRLLLEFDMTKEYGLELIRAIYEELNKGVFTGYPVQEVNHFKRIIVESACQTVYTEITYNEFCHELQLPPPNLVLTNPRHAGAEEAREGNGSYEGGEWAEGASVDVGRGCVFPGCIATSREHCANRMCRIHCVDRGRRECHTHRKFL